MTTFTDAQVAAFLAAREAELLAKDRRVAVAFTASFRHDLPASGGVYAFFHAGGLFYIGETTSLRQRLGTHMRNPENHVLALKIARQLFDRANGKGSAGSKKKFEEQHKEVTRQWVSKNLQVAFVATPIGRKELEDHLCGTHKPEFNKRYPVLP